MIERNIRKIATTTALLATLLLAGCATTPAAGQRVKLEGVASGSARIDRLYLQETDGKILLRGEVARIIHAHGQIPGHLHVELISAEGKLLKEADIGYRRTSSQTHDGSFELALPGPLPAGSTIRVTHHDPVSHLQEPVENPWRDVNGAE